MMLWAFFTFSQANRTGPVLAVSPGDIKRHADTLRPGGRLVVNHTLRGKSEWQALEAELLDTRGVTVEYHTGVALWEAQHHVPAAVTRPHRASERPVEPVTPPDLTHHTPPAQLGQSVTAAVTSLEQRAWALAGAGLSTRQIAKALTLGGIAVSHMKVARILAGFRKGGGPPS